MQTNKETFDRFLKSETDNVGIATIRKNESTLVQRFVDSLGNELGHCVLCSESRGTEYFLNNRAYTQRVALLGAEVLSRLDGTMPWAGEAFGELHEIATSLGLL